MIELDYGVVGPEPPADFLTQQATLGERFFSKDAPSANRGAERPHFRLYDNDRILWTVVELQQHVCSKIRQLSPEMSEEQIIHRYLAALDLTSTERHAILDEYRRRALGIRDKLFVCDDTPLSYRGGCRRDLDAL